VEPVAISYRLPKKGNAIEEYEDAAAAARLTFAVADGATESSFADRWAQLLVNTFIQKPGLLADVTPEAFKNWLAPLQNQWHQAIPWDKLPWYAEEKARSGAFAALCGVQFHAPTGTRCVSFWRRWFYPTQALQPKPGRWHAMAVGDTCLFHIRKNTLLKAFPISRSDSFSPRPLLLSSNPEFNNGALKGLFLAQGDYLEEDIFILATDALGCWFMKRHESGDRPWKTLLALKDQSDFETLIESFRTTGAIKNDDTTLLILRWDLKRREPNP
jgi:hypothetical protein